jgi:hypothetical protein
VAQVREEQRTRKRGKEKNNDFDHELTQRHKP